MSPSRATRLPSSAPDAGLTLPELMTVLVLVAIGVSLAMPVYSDWVARSGLRQAIVEVDSTLKYSRMAAMNRNQTVTVSLTLIGNDVQLTTGGVMPATMLNAQVDAFTGGPIQFNSLGLRVGGGAGDQLLTLTNGLGLTYSARVTPGGKTEWCPRATCP